jgi:hypothetical protein
MSKGGFETNKHSLASELSCEPTRLKSLFLIFTVGQIGYTRPGCTNSLMMANLEPTAVQPLISFCEGGLW